MTELSGFSSPKVTSLGMSDVPVHDQSQLTSLVNGLPMNDTSRWCGDMFQGFKISRFCLVYLVLKHSIWLKNREATSFEHLPYWTGSRHFFNQQNDSKRPTWECGGSTGRQPRMVCREKGFYSIYCSQRLKVWKLITQDFFIESLPFFDHHNTEH